jgi:hypothetical protein
MGGAIFNMQGRLTIRDSTLAANKAVGGADNVTDHGKGYGGAVLNMNGSLTAVGSTFADNTAADVAASVYNLVYDGATARTAQTTLRNTIVANGIGPEDLVSSKATYITPPNQGSANADVSRFDLVTSSRAAGAGTITGSPLKADPQLGKLKNNGSPTQTMKPLAGSPVINAGSAFGLTTDQRGFPRPYGFAPPFGFVPPGGPGDGSDIGAFEVQGPVYGARTRVTLALGAKKIPASGPLPVVVTNRNVFEIAGVLSGKTAQSVGTGANRHRIALTPQSFRVAAKGKGTVKLDLPQKLRDLLKKNGKLDLVLTAVALDPARHRRTLTKAVTPKLKQ